MRIKVGDEVIIHSWESRGGEDPTPPEKPWLGTVVGKEKSRFVIYEVKRDYDGRLIRLSGDSISKTEGL